MILNRRDLLATCAAGLPALLPGFSQAASPADGKERLGMVLYSFSVRLAADRKANTPGLADPLAFVEHCHQRGAGGVQLPIGVRDAAYAAKLREKVAAYGMYLEGSIRLPQDRADVDRFEAEVRTARECGVKVLRTVSLTGRRYETFATGTAFREWADRAGQALTRAESVIARHGLDLAVENHKDRRAGELVDLLKRLGSRYVGACVDTGNNLALLEDPLEVVAALAPWARSIHLKDMAVAEYPEGFLLAEVPLGEGFLDLKKIVATLRQARPRIHFNLEMITRDPLKVPCLTPKYWATFENLPGHYLARTLTLVRQHAGARPLTRVSDLPRERQLALEEENIRKSMAYARTHLDL
jgi:sugar phosphate isomerase/epimerase